MYCIILILVYKKNLPESLKVVVDSGIPLELYSASSAYYFKRWGNVACVDYVRGPGPKHYYLLDPESLKLIPRP